jgi:hypothetical protein
VANGTSGLDGTFLLGGFPTGKYKVEFVRSDLGSIWYNGQRTFDSADWVEVNAPNTTANIVGQLEPAAVISGQVTSAPGVGIPKVNVRAYDDATLQSLNTTAVTDSFGIYSLNNLSTGSIRLLFDSLWTGFFPEWWDDKKSTGSATPIALASGGAYPNKNAQLDPSSNIYFPLLIKN